MQYFYTVIRIVLFGLVHEHSYSKDRLSTNFTVVRNSKCIALCLEKMHVICVTLTYRNVQLKYTAKVAQHDKTSTK